MTAADFDRVEAEIKKLEGHGLFQSFDMNGNGVLSLAELDLAIVSRYPLLNHKPALQRAYFATVGRNFEEDPYIDEHELHAFLTNVFYFNKCFVLIFDKVDTDHDHRISHDEFVHHLSTLGLKGMSKADVEAEFNKMDSNHGGVVLFDEFCVWYARKMHPEGFAIMDAKIHEHVSAGVQKKKHFAKKIKKDDKADIHTKKFDAIEADIMGMLEDKGKLDSMWASLDSNGNGAVSTAEADLWCKSRFPILDHPRALTRAFTATIKEEHIKDALLHKKHFKHFMAHVFFYNKLFAVFEAIDTDKDHRVDFSEFKHGLRHVGLALTTKDAKKVFATIDRDGGGWILFEEFCSWVVSQKVPVD